jgi:hypothetical protein
MGCESWPVSRAGRSSSNDEWWPTQHKRTVFRNSYTMYSIHGPCGQDSWPKRRVRLQTLIENQPLGGDMDRTDQIKRRLYRPLGGDPGECLHTPHLKCSRLTTVSLHLHFTTSDIRNSTQNTSLSFKRCTVVECRTSALETNTFVIETDTFPQETDT